MSRNLSARLDRWTFQSLDTICNNVQDLTGIDLAPQLPASDWNDAAVGFEKRHLVAHKMGVVDQAYITKTGDTRHVIGRKISITADEIRNQSHHQATGRTYRDIDRSIACLGGARLSLVPLHRGFDDLVGAGPQRWQAFWLDEQFDAAGDAGSASDKAGTLES